MRASSAGSSRRPVTPPDGGRGPEVAFGDSASVLKRFSTEPLTASVWRRSLPTDFVEAAATWRHGPAFRRVVPVDDRRPALAIQSILESDGEAMPVAIARDLAQLLALHAVLVPDVARRLRVERIVDDGCRRFHADHVGSRMLCTYAGPGTECLPASAVDARRPADGSNDHVLDPDAVWRCEPGWVLLMRGTTGSGPAQFHRSPPRDATGPRLLVAIDA